MQDRGDGDIEVQLYIRQISPEHFRQYTLVAENSVSARSQDAVLMQSKSQYSQYSVLTQLVKHQERQSKLYP